MKKRSFLIVFFLFISAWLGLFLFSQAKNLNFNQVFVKKDNWEVSKTDNESYGTIKLKEHFFSQEHFYKSLKKTDVDFFNKDIQALILPHNPVLSSWISSGLGEVNKKVNKVIIIGPNHENLGPQTIATTKSSWETPAGKLEANQKLVDNLSLEFNIIPQQEFFRQEHSIGVFPPFVKNYFPQAEIVPIIISSYANYEDAEKLKGWLNQNADENTLIVYSIDFSHYLSKQEARKKDEISKDLIANEEIGKILRLNNDNTDSPVTLAVSLMLARERGWEREIFAHTNSFDLLGTDSSYTTSYFALFFYTPSK